LIVNVIPASEGAATFLYIRRAIHQGIQANLRQTIQVKLCQVIQAKLCQVIQAQLHQVTQAICKDSFKFIVESMLEGAQFAPTTFQTSINGFQLVVECNLILHSEGALFAPYFDRSSDIDSSKLIVICFELSFHFCEDYRIFREGEYQPYLGLQPQFGLRPQLGFWSQNDRWLRQRLHQSYVSLVDFVLIRIVGLVDCRIFNGICGLISNISLVGFIHIDFGDILSLGNLGLISLVGSSTLVDCWIFIGIGNFGCLFSLGGLTSGISLIGRIGRNGLIGLVGLVGRNGFVDLIGFSSLIGIVNSIGLNGLIGLALAASAPSASLVSFASLALSAKLVSSITMASLASALPTTLTLSAPLASLASAYLPDQILGSIALSECQLWRIVGSSTSLASLALLAVAILASVTSASASSALASSALAASAAKSASSASLVLLASAASLALAALSTSLAALLASAA
jgi:hypothetical protein